jgi:hypothetical protein
MVPSLLGAKSRKHVIEGKRAVSFDHAENAAKTFYSRPESAAVRRSHDDKPTNL